jgi:hypothetical protein
MKQCLFAASFLLVAAVAAAQAPPILLAVVSEKQIPGVLTATKDGALLNQAQAPIPNLATIRKAYIVPVDDLGNDVAVAACLTEHLRALTPIEAVPKDAAEAIFKVSAHLPSTTTKAMLGPMGGSPSAHLFVELPDGTKLWDDGAKYRRSMMKQGQWGASSGDTSKAIECGLADELANTLLTAMRKARKS